MPIGMPGGNATIQQWLDNLKDIPALFAAHGQTMPPDFAKRPPEEQQQILQQLITETQNAEGAIQAVQDSAKNQQQVVSDLQNSGVQMQPTASRRVFNLKKLAQFGQPVDVAADPAAGVATPPPADSGNPFDGQITDGGDLKNRLLQVDPDTAIKLLSEKFTNGQQQVSDPNNPNLMGDPGLVIKDAVNQFYETDDPQVQLDAASKLYETILPDGAKQTPDSPDAGYVDSKMETDVKPNTLQSQVQQTNDIIRKLAEEHAKVRKASSFNLSKSAQHQGVHNVIYFGPEQNHIDAFTGQLINDWHLVERNKGFGLRIDDVLNIDFEKIWRQSVMDKYSRPYRDKEGNWVGGYIESRFEVDKNIPPLNNYQLKPGELRKPVVPEHGITESRMEAARSKMNKDRGYKPAEKGEPFNWKEAGSKKKVTAQAEGIQPLQAPKLEGDVEPKNMQPNPNCRICGGNIAKMGKGKTPGVCKNCDARMPNPLQQQPGQQNPGMQNQAVPFNAQLSASGSVYFDGETQKFVVYAQTGPRRFDTYEEAEKFTNDPSIPSENASLDHEEALKAQLNPKQRKVWECADKLAIDG